MQYSNLTVLPSVPTGRHVEDLPVVDAAVSGSLQERRKNHVAMKGLLKPYIYTRIHAYSQWSSSKTTQCTDIVVRVSTVRRASLQDLHQHEGEMQSTIVNVWQRYTALLACHDNSQA